MVLRMDHVALSVADMERAIRFYTELFGFTVAMDRTFDTAMARLIGVPQAEVRIVHLQLEDTVLELFHYRTPQGRPPRPDARQSDLGLTHIGFLVSDLDEMQGRLQQRGVRWLGETVEIRPGVRVAYLYGAEGEVCELREIREAPKEAGGTIS